MLDLSHRKFLTWLAIIILVSHLYALIVFGATYWVDCVAFVSLGNCIADADTLKGFYNVKGTFIYSHLGAGLPFVWNLLSMLPDYWQWPVLAVFQHGLAAFALCYAFDAIYRRWPSNLHLAACALLCLLPFYQALHNSLLTESISSSLLLIGLGICLRQSEKDASFSLVRFCGLICVIFLETQFRSYFGAFMVAMGAVALFERRPVVPKRAWVCLLAVALLSATAFPIYRYALTGRFFMPGLGTNRLVCAIWANFRPTEKASAYLDSIPFPPDLPASKAIHDGLDYNQAAAIGEFWMTQGLTPRDVQKRVSAIANRLLNDRMEVFLTRVRCGFAASGFSWLAFAGSSKEKVYQFYSLPKQRKHQIRHYRYLSWATDSPTDERMPEFFGTPRPDVPFAEKAQDQMRRFLTPHLSTLSHHWRDPFFLSLLPPDIWALLGVAGMGVLVVKRRLTGLIFLLPVAVNMATAFQVPLGGSRYCYAMIPLYFLAASATVASLRTPAPVSSNPR